MIFLLVSTVSALKTYEVKRTGSETFEYRLNLLPVGSQSGAGYAMIRSVQNRGQSISSLVVRVSGFMVPANKVAEVRLIDEDSGQQLSLGQFITSTTGHAAFAATYRGYFHGYDQVVVSLEPWPDTSFEMSTPALSGDIVPGLTLVRTQPSVYGRTLGRISERSYTGYQSQVTPQLPYRRSTSIVTY